VVILPFIVTFKCAAREPAYNHWFTPLTPLPKKKNAPSGNQDRRVLFREVIAVLCQIFTNHIYTHIMWTLFKDFGIKRGGTCTNNWDRVS